MAGADVEEETERLRHFGSQREVVARRGREVKRRVGQQLDTARPLRRSLTSAGGDDDLELSMNLRRLDLDREEEDVGRNVQGSASISSSSAAGVLGGRGAEDARVAAVPSAGMGGVIVSGFGSSRVEDVAADERRRVAEGAQRGDQRRNDGTRGRMTTFGGEDLDRSKGGAWHARRR